MSRRSCVSRGNRSHCAKSPCVAGSIPSAVIDIYHWLKPSGSTMILGSTQLIKKWVPRIFGGSEGGQCFGFGEIWCKRPAVGSVHPSRISWNQCKEDNAFLKSINENKITFYGKNLRHFESKEHLGKSCLLPHEIPIWGFLRFLC